MFECLVFISHLMVTLSLLIEHFFWNMLYTLWTTFYKYLNSGNSTNTNSDNIPDCFPWWHFKWLSFLLYNLMQLKHFRSLNIFFNFHWHAAAPKWLTLKLWHLQTAFFGLRNSSLFSPKFLLFFFSVVDQKCICYLKSY